MNKINVLDKSIFNKISAGEVVDRPSSIVKELIENAIDAGATEINISIKDGGISEISVADNGIGIPSSEVEKAFLPHATSKISTEDDLNTIETLGFRGEALSSIASVTQVTLLTKNVDEDFATKLSLDGGNLVNKEITSRNNGTTLITRNLFYNTPARLKFLKKASYETTNINSIVIGLILSNPDVKFTYTVDDKLLYSHNGDGLFNAIIEVYGSSLSKSLLKVSENDDIIKVNGYISDRTLAKNNRTYQIFMVNNRLIKNTTITSAITLAYQDIMMKSKFPVAILNINIPLESIDVNVHPQKQEVKFEDNQRIFRAVYHAIKNTIDKNTSFMAADISVPFDSELLNAKQQSIEETYNSINEKTTNNKINDKLVEELEILRQSTFANKRLTKVVEDDVVDEKSIIKSTINNNFSSVNTNTSPFDHDYEYIGQIFKTYLIVEYLDSVYLIDIHATHEKVLFDKLKEQVNNRKIVKQMLLSPYILECDSTDYSVIYNNLEHIKAIGIDIEEFSATSFKITHIPLEISSLDLKAFFDDIVFNKDKLFRDNLSDLIREKLEQKACKARVKGNRNLSKMEIEYMLKLIKDKKPLQCPHGRPTVLELKKSDIEKMFKRLV